MDGCRPSHAQTSALRHVEQTAYRSLPRTSGMSSEAALRELLAAPVDSYEQAEPCTVMPYCYAEVSWPGSGGVMPLTSALPPSGVQELQYVVRQHQCGDSLDGRSKSRVYWDTELRRDGSTYFEFVRALAARGMVKYFSPLLTVSASSSLKRKWKTAADCGCA